jgi:hypothetical protein
MAGHIACMGEKRKAFTVFFGQTKKKETTKKRQRIILKRNLEIWDWWGIWAGLIWLRIGISDRLLWMG